nr:MAG: hypothetical protein CR975_04395 [Gammaproteobacteria bacterium]
MPEKQEKIYYLVADSKNTAKNSPHLEIFEKNGVEVLLMWEPIDEWMMSQLHEFDGKSFESINQTDITGELFDNTDSEKKSAEDKAGTDAIINKIKAVLGDKVLAVRESKRLTKTPSCVVLGEGGMTHQMAQIMKAAGQDIPEQKYIFEINSDHKMIKQLADMQEGETLNDWVNVLFSQALLAENGSLEDTAAYIATVNRLLG